LLAKYAGKHRVADLVLKFFQNAAAVRIGFLVLPSAARSFDEG
jgi:hypothetical protein